MTIQTYTPNQCPDQASTSYTLEFLRYSPDKLFPATALTKYPPIHLDAMGENINMTALMCFRVKSGNEPKVARITKQCNYNRYKEKKPFSHFTYF